MVLSKRIPHLTALTSKYKNSNLQNCEKFYQNQRNSTSQVAMICIYLVIMQKETSVKDEIFSGLDGSVDSRTLLEVVGTYKSTDPLELSTGDGKFSVKRKKEFRVFSSLSDRKGKKVFGSQFEKLCVQRHILQL